MPLLKLVTLDLDDTLWPVEPVIDHANRVLCNWLASNVPELRSGVPLHLLDKYRERVLLEQPELSHFVTRLRLQILEELLADAEVPEQQRKTKAKAAFSVFLHARHAVEYFPHARELLAHLANRFTIAALSNGNADVRKLEIGRHFDFAISAESIGASKPDPAMFLQACEKAGCAPQEALHIGDHSEHDVMGAISAGMHTLWVNFDDQDWNPELDYQPAREARCLSEVPLIIDELELRLRKQAKE